MVLKRQSVGNVTCFVLPLPGCVRLDVLKESLPTVNKESAESSSGRTQGQIRPVLIIAEYNFPDSLTAIKNMGKGGRDEKMTRFNRLYFVHDNKLCHTIFIE